MSKVTVTQTAKATKITVTNKNGDEMSAGLNDLDRDNLLYALIQTLPFDNHLRRHLNI